MSTLPTSTTGVGRAFVFFKGGGGARRERLGRELVREGSTGVGTSVGEGVLRFVRVPFGQSEGCVKRGPESVGEGGDEDSDEETETGDD